MRCFLLILLAVTIIISTSSLLVSCGGSGNANTDENPTDGFDNTDASESTEIPADLPERDFEGKTYTVLSFEEAGKKYYDYVEEMNNEIINDSVYKQQLAVQEKFNVNIAVIQSKDVNSTIRKSVSSGLYEYNITASHLVNQGAMALEGMYLDLYKMPSLNFDKPWWNKSAIDQLTMNGKVMLAFGDLATERSILFTHTFIFNKRLATEYSIDNLYELVRSGKWTYDALYQTVKGTNRDINGDGVMDENDQYGLLQSVAVAGVYRAAFGQPITSKDADGYPVLALNTPKMAEIVEKVYVLSYETEGVMTAPHAKEGTLGEMFANGQSLFYNGFFCDIDKLRAMEDDFGFLPFPKYDEAQEGYYTNVRGDNCMLGVPVTVPEGDYDFVGTITEALSAEGYKTVRPAVYETTLKTKVTRDEESIEMLDIITKGILIEFGLCYNDSGAGFMLWHMMDAKNRNFASFYEKNEPAYTKYYEKVIEAIKNLE